MAALNLSSPIHSPSSLRRFSSFSASRNTPTLSFYSLPKPKPTPTVLFPSTSLTQKTARKTNRLSVVVSALKNLSETESVPVSPENDEAIPSDSGVYAVYNDSGDLQFIGITRNLAASVLTHKKSEPELCFSVKVSFRLWCVDSVYLPNSLAQFWCVLYSWSICNAFGKG